MKLDEVLALQIKNGQYFSMMMESVKAKKGRTITKKSCVNARYGIDYSELQQVKEMDRSGFEKESWFIHTEHDSIVANKKDPEKLYIQVMNPKSSKIQYFENNKEITKQSLIEDGWFAPSELKEKEIPLTLTISLDNIKSINYKNAEVKGV